MARSKIKDTKGKPVKKAKNRDKLKASIQIDQKQQYGGGKKWTTEVTERNDNDPTIRYSHEGPGGKTYRHFNGVEKARNPVKGGKSYSKTTSHTPKVYRKTDAEIRKLSKTHKNKNEWAEPKRK